jgi:hypothetical protein
MPAWSTSTCLRRPQRHPRRETLRAPERRRRAQIIGSGRTLCRVRIARVPRPGRFGPGRARGGGSARARHAPGGSLSRSEPALRKKKESEWRGPRGKSSQLAGLEPLLLPTLDRFPLLPRSLSAPQAGPADPADPAAPALPHFVRSARSAGDERRYAPRRPAYPHGPGLHGPVVRGGRPQGPGPVRQGGAPQEPPTRRGATTARVRAARGGRRHGGRSRSSSPR